MKQEHIVLAMALLLIFTGAVVIFQNFIEGSYKEYKKGKSAKFILFWIYVLGALSMLMPYILTHFSILPIGERNPGAIGDAVNGLISPIFSFSGIILTFYAFWVQYQSNIEQRKDIEFERFENKFFQLLELHKSNIEEMNINNKIFRRKCFVSMYSELYLIYKILDYYYKNTPVDEKKQYLYYDIDKIDLAYKIFFFGIGSQSERQIDYYINDNEKHLLQKIKNKIDAFQNDYEEKAESTTKDTIVQTLILDDNNSIYTSYCLFEGHVHRLAHYFRHLFQTVKFVVEQDVKLLPDDKKYYYLKTLRAQLSNHEQLLLYYNSLSIFGREWISNGYFTKYFMIKNLPLPLAHFGIPPEERFRKEIEEYKTKGVYMFEWYEHKDYT